MKRAIVTYAAGAHEELLDVAIPTYKGFARRHGYDLVIGDKRCDLPAPWNKIPLLIKALTADGYDEVVWFDCDLVVVDPSEDFPPLENAKTHALVRHFEDYSEIPNSGVWRLNRTALQLLSAISDLKVFTNHGWWEQAALMTLMGYSVPAQDTPAMKTRCRCVYPTVWYNCCQFMRLCWNSHPQYRADHARIVHCSYPDMRRRLEVMRELVKNPQYDYPKFDEGGK